MLKNYRTRIFKLSSLVTLLLLLACAGALVYNAITPEAPVTIKEEQLGDPGTIYYENEETICGNPIIPVKACFVIDGSSTGYYMVENGLLGQFEQALRPFAGQNHQIRIDAYYAGSGADGQYMVDGLATTFSFMEISQNLSDSIKQFGDIIKPHSGDLPYKVIIEEGASKIIQADVKNENEDRILILFILSPNVGKLSDEDVIELKQTLSDNNISLYCVGLYDQYNAYKVDYSALERIVDSDRLYRHIPMEKINDIIVDIFETRAYANLDTDSSGVLSVNIPAPESGRSIRSVEIELYSTGGFSYDAVSSVSSTPITDSAYTEFSGLVSASDLDAVNDGLEYTIRVSSDDGKNVYCRADYAVADKCITDATYEPAVIENMTFFEAVRHNTGMNIELILWLASAALLAAFVIPIIYRIVRRYKYESSI